MRKSPESSRAARIRPTIRRFAALMALLAAFSGTSGAAAQAQSAAKGAIIPIRGVIDDVMRDSIERRIEEAQDAGVATLIFEMDTPGGVVTSALDIFRLIERADARTVAWVNPEAYSAGALISVACDEIWMSTGAAIGDCAPIAYAPGAGVQELGAAERAKAESPILQKFRDAAARNGYDQALSRAMVTVGEEVWWLQRVDDPDDRRFVTGEEKVKLIDEVEDDERNWQLVESFTNAVTGDEYPVSQPVDAADTLLTMSTAEAIAFGFARGMASDDVELAQRLNLTGTLMKFERTGWEVFAGWLNSPMVRLVLMAIVFVGAYMEFQSPGLIFPGVAALIALAIVLAAPYAAGLATAWPIVLFAVGLILLAIEIFVIPGFGIAGAIGLAALLMALIGSFLPPDPQMPDFGMPDMSRLWQGLKSAIQVLIGSIAVSFVGIVLLIRYLPETRVAGGILSGNPVLPTDVPVDHRTEVAQIGDVGIVTGTLRPGGQARFGQEVVEVTSQGEYIESGRRVQVIRREGMSVVVRPLSDENPTG